MSEKQSCSSSGIVDHQPELHALAGKLAIRETAEPGHDRGQPGFVAVLLEGLARLAARRPLRRHPGEIVDQEVGGGVEILGAPVAMAVGAVLDVVVAGRTIAVAGTGAVQILTPQQKLDGVVAGGDIGLDAARLLQRVGEQLLGDGAGVELLAADGQRGVGDHIGDVELVLGRIRCRKRRRRNRSAPHRAARSSPGLPNRRRSCCRSGTPRSACKGCARRSRRRVRRGDCPRSARRGTHRPRA